MNVEIENEVREQLREFCFPQFPLGLIDVVSLSDMESLTRQWKQDIGELERVINYYKTLVEDHIRYEKDE